VSKERERAKTFALIVVLTTLSSLFADEVEGFMHRHSFDLALEVFERISQVIPVRIHTSTSAHRSFVDQPAEVTETTTETTETTEKVSGSSSFL